MAKPSGMLSPMSLLSSLNTYDRSAFGLSPTQSPHLRSNTVTAGDFYKTSKNTDGKKGEEKTRNREDLQKRIAAYYQSVRNAGSYHEPTTPKNPVSNIWATRPVPRAFRRH